MGSETQSASPTSEGGTATENQTTENQTTEKQAGGEQAGGELAAPGAVHEGSAGVEAPDAVRASAEDPTAAEVEAPVTEDPDGDPAPDPSSADTGMTPADQSADDPDGPADQSDDPPHHPDSEPESEPTTVGPTTDPPTDGRHDPGTGEPAHDDTLPAPPWAIQEITDGDWRRLEEPFLSASTTLMPRIGGSNDPRARGVSSSTRWSESRIDRRGPGSGPAGGRAPGYPPAAGYPSATGYPSAPRVRGPHFPPAAAHAGGTAGGFPSRAGGPAGAAAAHGGASTSGSDALNVSKVLAGGMAAATSAIFGSYFGAFGTVGGAAVGSVATALVTRLYQRSIERTGSKVLATVKGGEGSTVTATGPGRLAELDTVRLDRPPRARRTGPMVRATLLVFVLGLGLVTGIEMAKGSSVLGHHQGTSMQRLFDPVPSAPPAPAGPPGDDGASADQPDNAPDQSSAPSVGESAPGSGQLAPLGHSATPKLPNLTTVPTPTLRPDRRDLSVLPGPVDGTDHGGDLLRGLPGESDHDGDRDRHGRSDHHEDSDQLAPGLSLGDDDNDR